MKKQIFFLTNWGINNAFGAIQKMMILWADAVIQNSVVEFYKKNISVKIRAKKIEKKELVDAYDVKAEIVVPPYQNATIQSKKLTFNPETFECKVLEESDLHWGDLHMKSSELLFRLKEHIVSSQVLSKAYYRQWVFDVSAFEYTHEKKTLTCDKGCTIIDTRSHSKMMAQYAVAHLDKWFKLSKAIIFQNQDVEVYSEFMKCFLNEMNDIEKIDASKKLKLKTRDGKITVRGDRMVYQNNKATLSGNIQCIIEKEL